MARMIAWDDDPDTPMLVLEDLSAGHWPPPWRPGDVERVAAALDTLHGTSPPASLGPIPREAFEGWPTVAREPEPFLRLELAPKDWLDRNLPTLLEAEAAARLEGSELLHLDVRSDNICLLDDRVVFIDWNNACLGNGSFDFAAWLPSLHAEGGPPPWSMLPGQRSLRALFRATSRPEQDSRHPEAPPKSEPSNSSNSGPRSPGRYES